jgi:translocator protein
MINKEWYSSIKKSNLTPPNYIFGIVWPILYTLIFVSLIVIFSKGINRLGLLFFILQFICNIIWSPLFFKYKKIKLALLDLILTIIFTGLTIYYFYKKSKLSAYLLVPYMIWICFALYLNLFIVINN